MDLLKQVIFNTKMLQLLEIGNHIIYPHMLPIIHIHLLHIIRFINIFKDMYTGIKYKFGIRNGFHIMFKSKYADINEFINWYHIGLINEF